MKKDIMYTGYIGTVQKNGTGGLIPSVHCVWSMVADKKQENNGLQSDFFTMARRNLAVCMDDDETLCRMGEEVDDMDIYDYLDVQTHIYGYILLPSHILLAGEAMATPLKEGFEQQVATYLEQKALNGALLEL